MSNEVEYRLVECPLSMRAAAKGELVFKGCAAPYNQVIDYPSVWPLWTEEYAAGCFSRALKDQDDAVLNVDHCGLPLARVASGTLILEDSTKGLMVSASLVADDPDVRNIYYKIERGDLSKMSCAFVVDKCTIDYDSQIPHRKIESVTLYDVSIVSTPAYSKTEISLNSRDRKLIEGVDMDFIRSRTQAWLDLACKIL